jgi:DNA-binding PadR family transcriptional regulator
MNSTYKVPFYILGYLIRLGPLHGYQLKADIEREASDFAKIKLPNLYYHLASMREKGWIEAEREKEGNRPEKDVYSVTAEGKAQYEELLHRCLMEPVDWDFPLDGALFFSKDLSPEEIEQGLLVARARADAALMSLSAHRMQVLAEVPAPFGDIACLILSHHEGHYAAERAWLCEAIEVISARKGS